MRGLVLALAVTGSGFVFGTLAGTVAGLRGGWIARGLSRACDLVQAFPTFLIALAVLAAVPSPSRGHLGAVFALTAWAPFARMALGQARILARAPYVEAARALGASRARLLVPHVVPNLLGPVLVQAGSSAAAVVVAETALGFVGLGPRDGVSLGVLLEQGTLAMLRAPHVLLISAAAVAMTSGTLQAASEAWRR